MITLLRRAAADTKGASAVEFALVLPFMFMLHIGAAEALQAYVAQRNVAHVAATMADITSRNRTVSTAELDDILSASTSVMYPFPATQLQLRISSLSASSSGSVSTDWTTKRDYTETGNPSIPDGYLLANESVIVTDVIYEYRPTFGIFLPETIRMTRHSYVRPRLSSKVEKVS